MNSFIKHIIFGIVTLFATVAFAKDPGLDNLNRSKEIDPKTEVLIKTIFKINHKEVKDVFLKIKVVDDIFKPSKKITKKKYTIA